MNCPGCGIEIDEQARENGWVKPDFRQCVHIGHLDDRCYWDDVEANPPICVRVYGNPCDHFREELPF